MSINKQQLEEMIELQNRMNCKVDPNWAEKGRDWELAILVESTEAIEHHGWKWWKKQEKDDAQLQIEIIDIWHFILCDYIEIHGKIGAVARIHDILEDKSQNVVYLDDLYFSTAEMSLLSKLRLLSCLAGLGRSTLELKLFESIMIDSGLTWDSLHKLYIGKNILNIFRQDNGYQENTYIKNWFGEEDNVVLDKILKDTPSDTEDFANVVYNKLRTSYTELRKLALAAL